MTKEKKRGKEILVKTHNNSKNTLFAEAYAWNEKNLTNNNSGEPITPLTITSLLS